MSDTIPNADCMQALIDGKEVEFLSEVFDTWHSADYSDLVENPQFTFRVKPSSDTSPHVFEAMPVRVFWKAPGEIHLFDAHYNEAPSDWVPLGKFKLMPYEEQTP